MVSPYSGSPTAAVPLTGDYRADALIGGVKWGGAAGTATTVSYSFPKIGSAWSTSSYGGYGPAGGGGEPWSPQYAGLTTAQQTAVRAALSTWSDVANITFSEVVETSVNVGDIRFAWTGAIPDAYAAWAYYPYAGPVGGDVWLNPDTTSATFGAGSYAYLTVIHELGHAIGLKHPFEGSVKLPQAEDSFKYSIMSYTGHAGASTQPVTPMLYDVLAVQAIYGANLSTRADDTSYSFAADRAEVRTVWDGGGVDTFDLSNQTIGARVSLVAGTFSAIGRKSGTTAATDNIAIAFGATIENVIGTAYADVIVGNETRNHLAGGGGNDSLSGGFGRDTLLGGAGDDTLSGDRDSDVLDGGDGNDTADFRHTTAKVTIDLNAGIADFGSGGVDTLIAIENVIGSNGASIIFGSPAANRLDGAAGHDRIDGRAGNDTLLGGTGNDTLSGGPGIDLLDGGSGTDTADYGDETVSLRIDLGAGTAAIGSAGIETLISIESVIGGGGADTLIGSGVANRLEGGAGDDFLDGGAGIDTLIGGAGNDTLLSGSGIDSLDGGAGFDLVDFRHTGAAATIDLVAGTADFGASGVERIVSIEAVIGSNGPNLILGSADANRLDGAAGNDTLDGGFGNDTLIGGAGNDLFRFSVMFGSDTVLDFDRDGDDRIALDRALGIAGFSALDLNGSGVLDAGDFGVSVAAGSTTLLLDGNTLVIAGATMLTQADFWFF